MERKEKLQVQKDSKEEVICRKGEKVTVQGMLRLVTTKKAEVTPTALFQALGSTAGMTVTAASKELKKEKSRKRASVLSKNILGIFKVETGAQHSTLFPFYCYLELLTPGNLHPGLGWPGII